MPWDPTANTLCNGIGPRTEPYCTCLHSRLQGCDEALCCLAVACGSVERRYRRPGTARVPQESHRDNSTSPRRGGR